MDIHFSGITPPLRTFFRNVCIGAMAALLIAIRPGVVYGQETPISPTQTKVEALYEKILEEGKMTHNLTPEDLASLPVGISRNIGGNDYTIIIDSARFTPQGAFFNAYLLLEFKATGDRILFGATNLGFHPGGLSGTTSSKLVLMSEHHIPITNKIALILPKDGTNYVEFDCNGFKSVNLKGIFEFGRDLLVPDETSTAYRSADRPNAPDKVRATFEANSTDWGSIMATVNITPFGLPGVKGLRFNVQDAIVDLSDVANPPDFQFPKDYISSDGDNINLWQGFFLRQVDIRLFDELQTGKGEKKITAQNVLIDKMGVSGAFGIKGLFGRDEGSLNGWAFSVDSLGVVLVKNKLKGGALRGELNVPLFDNESPMKYSALISQQQNETDFVFTIQPGKTLKASVLAADIELYPTTTFIIAKTNGKIKPEAILQGKVSIAAGEKLNISDISFEDLHIASEAPYIRSGHWSISGKGKNKSGKFPLVINKLDFTHSQNLLKLTVDGELNLMNAEDKGFAARAVVSVTGEMVTREETVGENTVTRHAWKYKETKLSDITIDIKGGVYAIKGRLSFYEKDAVYGNGFRGEVDAQFTPGPGIKVVAQFGTVNDMRYWYVDGRVRLPAPIGTGFGFYGFGGGMYYHMILKNADVYSVEDFVNKTGEADKYDIGATRSGASYIPSADIGLGLKASVMLGIIPSPEPFNGDATFEIAFNSNGGVRLIRLRGEGYFMTPIEKRSATAPLYADLDIVYDFVNSSLHANLDVYVNIAGILRGIHPNGLAGSAVMHFDADQWYIHIGTPQQQIGLNFIGLVEARSYFMVGTLIPGMPAPPSNVSEILGGMDLGFMRDENALAGGGGFAFGASLQVKTKRLEVLIFYGEFGAGLGFDIMLKNYGNAHCVGNSGKIGINGWYASGQAWAYLQGAIGVFVDLTFIKGEFEILRIGAAAVLQAKLPNPIWMRGVVGGQFSILGGLIKGNCRFTVTIGQECEIEGANPLTGVKVIASVKPQQAEGDVSVFTAPQAAFNVPVEKEFEMMDIENNYKAYRVRLEHFQVKHDGKAVAGSLQWNDTHDVAIFNPSEILPPKATLKAEVAVSWEEKTGGSWRRMGNAGENETTETQFTTGEAPKNIPEDNVLYSYPVTGQFNFLKQEYPHGYMKLKVGQSYLFDSQEGGTSWGFVARFTPAGQPVGIDAPLVYEAGNSFIRYAIPQNLATDKPYTITYVKVPLAQTALDKNVTTSEQQLVQQEGVDVSSTTKTIDGVYTLADDKILYESYFRSSKYTTFEAKLNDLSGYTSVGRIVGGINVFEAGAWGQLGEVFDKTDISGRLAMEPLIQMEALTNNSWYQDHIYPLVYQSYPTSDKLQIRDWRDPAPAGVPPLRSIALEQNVSTPQLQAEDVYESTSFNPAGRVTFMYRLPYFAYKDYYELKNKALDVYFNNSGIAVPTGAYRLINTPFYDLTDGQYQFIIRYKLPGLNTVTTSRTLTIDW